MEKRPQFYVIRTLPILFILCMLNVTSALIWDFTKRKLVVYYRRFGYNVSVRSSRDGECIPKRRYETTIICCVKSQNSAGLIYSTKEVKSDAFLIFTYVVSKIRFIYIFVIADLKHY